MAEVTLGISNLHTYSLCKYIHTYIHTIFFVFSFQFYSGSHYEPPLRWSVTTLGIPDCCLLYSEWAYTSTIVDCHAITV